ncbi:MAG: hypothetical protein AB8B67_02590 [Rickettsiaceae bacterium]
MNNSELYSLLFTDVFASNLVFISEKTFVIDTLKAFRADNSLYGVIIATFAASVGMIVNYCVGILFYNILKLPKNKRLRNGFKYLDEVINFATKYHVFLLLLVLVPFMGKFVQIMIGLARISLIKFTFACIILNIIYYSVLLLI